MDRVDETAWAKVNLDLRVCARRPDGYHDLDSLVVFAEVGDRLRFAPADGLHLTIGGRFGQELSEGEDNLVMRAARALAAATGRKAEAGITLDKRLPVASGLGGGSADAAATLRGLTTLWKLPLGLADLVPLARGLGADVPVCLGSTAVRMQGTGDRLTTLSLPASPWMVLVNPGRVLSTPDVFGALARFSGTRDQTWSGDVRRHLAESVNDLEAPALGIVPDIGTVLGALRGQPGCALARMSGSGATCFGLFDDGAACSQAVDGLSAAHPDWWIAGTRMR